MSAVPERTSHLVLYHGTVHPCQLVLMYMPAQPAACILVAAGTLFHAELGWLLLLLLMTGHEGALPSCTYI